MLRYIVAVLLTALKSQFLHILVSRELHRMVEVLYGK